MRKQSLVRLVCVVVCVAWGLSHAEPPKQYVLGVVPQFDVVTIHKQWAPLVAKLSRELGIELALKHYPSIPAFEADLEAGGVDFAYMNPYHALLANKKQGYLPLLRGDHVLKGILVVRKGSSSVQTLGDLEGQEVAFPAPNAFGASLYMRALLTEKHHLHFKPSYVLSHGNVYRQVILGLVPAGGGIEATLNQEKPEVRDQLTIIFSTPATASHPLCAHPRVPEELRKRLTQAVLAFPTSEEGVGLLKTIQWRNPVPADYVRDYEPLGKLSLEKYVLTED